MTLEEAYQCYVKDERLDTYLHLPRLREWAQGNVLEIGVYTGISTTALLLGVGDNGGHVWSLDMNPACGYMWNAEPDWTFIAANSRTEQATVLAEIPHRLDLLFIDGSHKFQDVWSDLWVYGNLVKRGGIIAVHDVLMHDYFPDVRHAFERYCHTAKEKKVIYPGSCGLGVVRVGGTVEVPA